MCMKNILHHNEKFEEISHLGILQAIQETEIILPKEVIEEIIENINPKKFPESDSIAGETHLINAALRFKYVPILWQTVKVIIRQTCKRIKIIRIYFISGNVI